MCLTPRMPAGASQMSPGRRHLYVAEQTLLALLGSTEDTYTGPLTGSTVLAGKLGIAFAATAAASESFQAWGICDESGVDEGNSATHEGVPALTAAVASASSRTNKACAWWSSRWNQEVGSWR
jgi:hypothetical protein